MKETRNAVDDRQTIYYSPVASPTAAHAVDTGKLRRSPVARIIPGGPASAGGGGGRQGGEEEQRAPRRAQHRPRICEARKKVLAEVEKLLAKKKRKKPAPKPVVTREAHGVLVDGTGTASILGRKLRLTVAENGSSP